MPLRLTAASILRILGCVVILGNAPLISFAQDFDKPINFPDVPGYHTLKVDLHMHTVFSDGDVWPNVRVQEAVREGLDAIAMTDHIEYQPHEDDIPHPDRNRSYDIAAGTAARLDSNLMVIKGSEITRSMPPGHSNAIFLNDVNPMIQEEAVDAFREAARQGGFTFWNHPMWIGQRPSGIPELTDVHRQLIADTLLHGIEVVNMHDYSAEALQIALDHNLTIIGTSDIHSLIQWEFEHDHYGHRPITLVFATERSQESLREGLFAGRTVVWFRSMLIGRQENVIPLIHASLSIVDASYDRDRSVLAIEIGNRSDVEYILKSRSDFNFHQSGRIVTIKPNDVTMLYLKTVEQVSEVSIPFDVLNVVVAPDEHPSVVLDVTVD